MKKIQNGKATLSDIQKLFERIIRLKKRLEIKEGEGAFWKHGFSQTETHYITINGVKSPEEIEDDITSAIVWVWSIKDYAVKVAKEYGKNQKWVENEINSYPNLCICADLANSAKHFGYDRGSRSSRYPKLSPLSYKLPHTSLDKIAFGAFTVTMDVADPEAIDLEMNIFDNNSKEIGCAFTLLESCLEEWEQLINKIKNV